MTTTRRFIRPGVSWVSKDRWGSWYDWHGDRFWSVTTIIRGGTSNKGLQAWEGNVVADTAVSQFRRLAALMEPINGEIDEAGAYEWLRGAPKRYMEYRGSIGTTLHDYAEAHATGKPMPAAVGEVADMLTQFHEWIAAYQPEFLLAEAPIFSRSEQYAGTLDIVAEFPRELIPDDALAHMTGQQTADLAFYKWTGVTGDPTKVRLLVDYKTGKSVYQDVALQLAAYRHADFVGLPDNSEQFMYEVDGAAVLHVRGDGYQFVPVATGDEVFQSFLYVREVYRWGRDLGKSVLGAPMVAPSPQMSMEVE